MSEEGKNEKIDEKKIAETIDNTMFRALKDLCMEKYKEMICEKLESLEKQKKFFRIITKDGNVITANHFDSSSRYDEELSVFLNNSHVAQIKYETIENIYEW